MNLPSRYTKPLPDGAVSYKDARDMVARSESGFRYLVSTGKIPRAGGGRKQGVKAFVWLKDVLAFLEQQKQGGQS